MDLFALIPYVVTLMILYDVSIHFIYLTEKENFFIKNKIKYWPVWRGKEYQVFWTIYWGTALILMIIYLIWK